MSDEQKKIIIQFDGICVLCSSAVHFLLKADRKKKFLFQALPENPKRKTPESIIVTDGTKTFQFGDAILKICSELGGIFLLANIFKILPKKFRDQLYRWVAQNRYKWFGTKESCFLPAAKDRDRFI